MAITPISNALTRNYNIGFTGKNKKSENNNIRENGSIIKAIPLATLLAMSPLVGQSVSSPNKYDAEIYRTELVAGGISNSIKQSSNVIDAKSFKYADGSGRTVNFIDSDGNANNFERVQIVESWPTNKSLGVNAGSAVYELKSVSKYNYNIQGDDGQATSPMTFVRLNLESANKKDRKISDKEVCDYLVSSLNSSKNNSDIAENNVKRNLRPTMDTDYSLQNVPNGDILQQSVGFGAKLEELNAKKIGSQPFSGENGEYEISYYTLHDNDKAQLVTVKGETFPEMCVFANISNNASFEDYGTASTIPQKFNYGQTVLMDSDHKTYNISDRALAMALMAIYENESIEDPFVVKGVNNRYMVFKTGTISHMDESESASIE